MSPRVVGLKAEHHRDPIGIGTPSPRLSWRVEGAGPGWIQSSYEVSGGSTAEGPGQVLVPWPGAPLASRERRSVRVRVTGPGGETSGWSEPLDVEAGLLSPDDWTARLVGNENRATAEFLEEKIFLEKQIVERLSGGDVLETDIDLS